jgi:hypothetical protein
MPSCVVILVPNTGAEVIEPGRQGIRAQRDHNPARRSANLL